MQRPCPLPFRPHTGQEREGGEFHIRHLQQLGNEPARGVDFVLKEEKYTDRDGKEKYRGKWARTRCSASWWPMPPPSAVQVCAGRQLFANAGNMKCIDGLDRYFIMATKDNRRVALSREDKLAGKYISITKALAEGCVRTVYVEQLDFPILITKQVFKTGWSAGTLYLSGNDLNLSHHQMTTIYKKRWKVEEYHKSIKSNTAFQKSPTSNVTAQKSHFVASILSTVKLERLKIRHGKNHFALKSLLMKNATISAWQKLNTLKMTQNNNVCKAA